MSTDHGRPLEGPLASTGNSGDAARGAGSAPAGDATAPPSSARISRSALRKLAGKLSERDRAIITAVGELRLLRTDQVERLFFSELQSGEGRARVCRRALQRLVEASVLRPLGRRVGGVRAGSSGTVYALAPAGRRLLAYWMGAGLPSNRGVHEPGLLFVAHTLAIADLYVLLVEAERKGSVELLTFEAEPARSYLSAAGATMRLRPDALVQLGSGDYEYVSFCEIDLATAGRGALVRKCRAYFDYLSGGRAEHGIIPRAVWITPTGARAAYLSELIAGLGAPAMRFFAVTTTDDALGVLSGADIPAKRGGRP